MSLESRKQISDLGSLVRDLFSGFVTILNLPAGKFIFVALQPRQLGGRRFDEVVHVYFSPSLRAFKIQYTTRTSTICAEF